jgi:outer membrane receptor protein involved in Fe transport
VINQAIRPERVRACVATILGASTILAAAPTFAQDQLEEVLVTGSRIRRANDFDTANPTTVVDADFFKDMGIVNVGDAIKQLPANVSNNSPTTTGNANFFAGSTIANLRGLNPFFGSRTLNLVNGRRFVPTNQGDGVDLNFIPSILIDRMDVVTGGASAAYGSGAISGVNNVFLNRKLEGGKLDVDYGRSERGDAQDRHIAAAFGTAFAGDRGRFVLGFEHQKSDAVGCISVRDWCAEGNAFIQNPANPANGGTDAAAPAYLLASNVRASQLTTAGVFQNFAAPFGVPTLGVNAAGTGTVPFANGTGANGSPFNLVVGGDGRSVYEYTNLRAPVKRDVGAGTLIFALTDSLNLSVDLSYGKVETSNRTGALDANFTTIAADNAYLTPALRAAQQAYNLGGPAAAGFAPAFFNKDWTAQLNSHSDFETKVKRGAIGLDGEFGDSSWTWDGYYQYGVTDRSQLVADNRHLNAYNLATDAVIDNRAGSATLGQPVCRVTRDGVPTGPLLYDPAIATGCVPLNPFGTGAIPAAAKAYSFGYLLETLNYKQQVLAFNTTGDLFEGFGAGAIKGAAGLEYRREEGTNIGSQGGAPDYVRTDYLIQYGESFSGKVDVIEGYVETNIPVLRGVTGAQRLEFDVSARESSYHNKGGAGTSGVSATNDMTTWKVSGIWDPVDWLRVRGSQSRDSRAANFRELYYGQKIKAGGTFGFCGPVLGAPVDPCNWSLEGNTALKPEKSDTTTVGLVFTPSNWLPGFQFAADYFRIEISDSITQASVFRVLQGCQIAKLPEFCSLLVPEVPGDYSNIRDLRALAYNGSGYEYSGIDFTGSYRLDLADASSLNLRLIATRMLKQTSPNGFQPGATVDVLGQTGTSNNFLSDNQPSAKWIGNLSATWLKGGFSATAQMRYVSSGVADYRGSAPGDAFYGQLLPGSTTERYVQLSTNSVPSYSVFALNASYTFTDLGVAKSLQLWGGIDNLFDKDPPIGTGDGFGGAVNGGTNPVFFDTMGRYFKVGLRTTF